MTDQRDSEEEKCSFQVPNPLSLLPGIKFPIPLVADTHPQQPRNAQEEVGWTRQGRPTAHDAYVHARQVNEDVEESSATLSPPRTKRHKQAHTSRPCGCGTPSTSIMSTTSTTTTGRETEKNCATPSSSFSTSAKGSAVTVAGGDSSSTLSKGMVGSAAVAGLGGDSSSTPRTGLVGSTVTASGGESSSIPSTGLVGSAAVTVLGGASSSTRSKGMVGSAVTASGGDSSCIPSTGLVGSGGADPSSSLATSAQGVVESAATATENRAMSADGAAGGRSSSAEGHEDGGSKRSRGSEVVEAKAASISSTISSVQPNRANAAKNQTDTGEHDGLDTRGPETQGLFSLSNVLAGQVEVVAGTSFPLHQLQLRLSSLRERKASISRQLRECINTSGRTQRQDELLCCLLVKVDRQIKELSPVAWVQRRLRTVVGVQEHCEEKWIRIRTGHIPESISASDNSDLTTWSSALEKDYTSPNDSTYVRRVICSSSLAFELLMLFSLKASIHVKMGSIILKGQVPEELLGQDGAKQTFSLRHRLKDDEWGRPVDHRGAFPRENLTAASKHIRAAAGSYATMAYQITPLLGKDSLGISPPEKHPDILVGFRDLCLGCSISCVAYLAAERKSSFSIISKLLSAVSQCTYSAYLRIRSDSDACNNIGMKDWYRFGRPWFSNTVSSDPSWEELSSASVDSLVTAPIEFRGVGSLTEIECEDIHTRVTDELITPAPAAARSRIIGDCAQVLASSSMVSRALSHEYAARECQRALDSDTGLPCSLVGFACTENTHDRMVIFQCLWAHSEASLTWISRAARSFEASHQSSTAEAGRTVAEPFRSLYDESMKKKDMCISQSNSIYHTCCPSTEPLIIPYYSGWCLFLPQEGAQSDAARQDILKLSLYSKVAPSLFVDEIFSEAGTNVLLNYVAAVTVAP
eukprot:gb/GECG01014025.1/.p1 GENE.gb/GECG01014025.1/~~gb/GECG01014025.1/.p1  ORF type:complete len:922 (+),score=83.00 gb/GECG01014025.1/:1-2766(+)